VPAVFDHTLWGAAIEARVAGDAPEYDGTNPGDPPLSVGGRQTYLEGLYGRPYELIRVYGSAWTGTDLNTTRNRAILSGGAFLWASMKVPSSLTWAQVTLGSQDAQIQAHADQLKAAHNQTGTNTVDQVLVFTPHHEPQGDSNGNASTYVPFYAHYRSVFLARMRLNGAGDLAAFVGKIAIGPIFFGLSYHDGSVATSTGVPGPWWPGTSICDFAGADPYNWNPAYAFDAQSGNCKSKGGYAEFSSSSKAGDLRDFCIGQGIQALIGETGTFERAPASFNAAIPPGPSNRWDSTAADVAGQCGGGPPYPRWPADGAVMGRDVDGSLGRQSKAAWIDHMRLWLEANPRLPGGEPVFGAIAFFDEKGDFNRFTNSSTQAINAMKDLAASPVMNAPLSGNTVTGAASLSGTGGVSVSGNLTRIGSATLGGSGGVIASPFGGGGTGGGAFGAEAFGSEAFDTGAGGGPSDVVGAAVLSGTGSLTASGRRTIFGDALLDASGWLVASSAKTVRGAGVLTGRGSLVASSTASTLTPPVPIYRLALAELGTTGLGAEIIHDVFKLTGVDAEQVPFTWGKNLDAAGSISAAIPIDAISRDDFVVGARELHVYRDGGGGEDLVWAGRLWQADVQGWFVRLGGEGFWSSLRRRFVKVDKRYVRTDQADIARDLISYTQGLPGGDLGITFFDTADTGVKRDLLICAEERRSIAEVIETYAAAIDGFDFDVSPGKVFRIWSPHRGIDLSSVVHFDGALNFSDISYTEDGSSIADEVSAVGPVDDCEPISVLYATDSAGLSEFGLLEGVVTYDQDDDAFGQAAADETLRLTKAARWQPTIVVPSLPGAPTVEDFDVGDVVRLSADRGYATFDELFRVVAFKVDVDRMSRETLTIELDSALPESPAPRDVSEANLFGQGDLLVAGTRTRFATANLTGQGSLVADWGKVTFFGLASTPADNAAQDSTTVSVVPPGSMRAGDLVLLIYGARSSLDNPSITTDGGQTWNALPNNQSSTGVTARLWWAQFNGTWGANPVLTGSNSAAKTAYMAVFRPANPTDTWSYEGNYATDNFNAPVSPFDVTHAAGITTVKNGALAVAVWLSADDNAWSLQTAGWANPGDLAQVRNTQGSQTALSVAYKVMTTAGATGSVTNRQTANGGDGGACFMVAFAV